MRPQVGPGVFSWPWCFSHNAPMIGTPEGFVCHWADLPVQHGDAEGCEAITIHFQYVGAPFDLSQHPKFSEKP